MFGRWHVPDRAEQPAVIEPIYPPQRRELHRLIALREVSVPLILAQLDGQLRYMKSAECQRAYMTALMMRPPVRRREQRVQPMVLPMNPANDTFVALCAILTAIGEKAAVARINDGLMYNQTLSVYAGDVLRGYRARLLAR